MVSGVSPALESARSHRRALAASHHEWVGRTSTLGFDQHGKHLLDVAWLAEGSGYGAELDLADDSRAVPWELDMEDVARRLSICESSAHILYNVAAKRWQPRSLGCQLSICPVCARARAARANGRWRAVLAAATDEGAELRHWTFTQPRSIEPGGLVTPDEVTRFKWRGTVASDGVRARAVGGEGLGAAYRRLRKALTAVRENATTRDRWRAGLGGHLVGCEWTGRAGGGIPSWHAHVHILGCTPAGVAVAEGAMLRDWCRLTGGSIRAQHVRRVDPDAVAEVLKYPFKPAHLTSAQRIETLAYMRGMHPHHVSGSWSPLSKARREQDCWGRWLEARPESPEFLRLHFIPDAPGAEPELWTGYPATGRVTFAVRRRHSKTVDNPALQGWCTFERDAAGFTRLLREDPGRDGPLPEVEPGADLAEDWFNE